LRRCRGELYAEIIFPVLLAGSNRNDAWSLYWLAETIQHLKGARKLYEVIKFKTRTDLLKDAYAVDRDSIEIRKALLKSLWSEFDYASHEWPSGILWRPSSRPVRRNHVVALARELDRECAYAVAIDEFEGKVKQYYERLIS